MPRFFSFANRGKASEEAAEKTIETKRISGPDLHTQLVASTDRCKAVFRRLEKVTESKEHALLLRLQHALSNWDLAVQFDVLAALLGEVIRLFEHGYDEAIALMRASEALLEVLQRLFTEIEMLTCKLEHAQETQIPNDGFWWSSVPATSRLPVIEKCVETVADLQSLFSRRLALFLSIVPIQ